MPTPDRQELPAVFAGGAIGALCRGLLEEAYPAAASGGDDVSLRCSRSLIAMLGLAQRRFHELLDDRGSPDMILKASANKTQLTTILAPGAGWTLADP
ncbi:MAG TPA: hypothetical protein VN327_03280, partial [Pseudonocardiaceae bacterium]|nr:hypothetical protein [Pseudonocardiaceae bacterium]